MPQPETWLTRSMKRRLNRPDDDPYSRLQLNNGPAAKLISLYERDHRREDVRRLLLKFSKTDESVEPEYRLSRGLPETDEDSGAGECRRQAARAGVRGRRGAPVQPGDRALSRDGARLAAVFRQRRRLGWLFQRGAHAGS